MRKCLIVLTGLLVLVGCSKPKEEVEEKVEKKIEVITCTINEKSDTLSDIVIIEHENDVMNFIESTKTYNLGKEVLDKVMEVSDKEFAELTVGKIGPGIDVKRNKINDTEVDAVVKIDFSKTDEELGDMAEDRDIGALEFAKGLEPIYTCK